MLVEREVETGHLLVQSAGTFKLKYFLHDRSLKFITVMFIGNIITLPENLLYFQVKKIFYIMNW